MNRVRFDCGRLHCRLLDPIDKVLDTGVHTGNVFAGTSNAIGHHSDLVEDEIAIELMRDHQWTARVSLARILATFQIASTQNGAIELLSGDQLSNGLVLIHALILGQHRQLQLLEDIGGISSLRCAAPAGDERHETFIVFAADGLADRQTDRRDSN